MAKKPKDYDKFRRRLWDGNIGKGTLEGFRSDQIEAFKEYHHLKFGHDPLITPEVMFELHDRVTALESIYQRYPPYGKEDIFRLMEIFNRETLTNKTIGIKGNKVRMRRKK